MLLFLQPVNDRFSWCLPQILLTFCHRAARNPVLSQKKAAKTERQSNADSGPRAERGWVKEAGFDTAYCPAVCYARLPLLLVKCPCEAKGLS